MPDWVKELSIPMPDWTIHMGKIDFFLTTNLLMPTEKVISIDDKIGIQVPGDLFIVGKLIQK